VKGEYPRELGIGVVYTPRLARVLDLDLVDVLEIEPQMFWRATGDPQDPIRIDLDLFGQLRAMPHHRLVHSVTLPVGNSRPHDPRTLKLLEQSIAALDAPYASEHLSFNEFEAGPERLWTGFLLPPKQDRNGVETAAARIAEMQRAVGVPVAIETGVNYLQPQCDELSDGRFVRCVAEAADCGILLDLHNLLTNERNGRASVRDVFDEIPRERVWEIHLAGGMQYRGYWLDSHSGHMDEELFAVARAIVGECPNLQAIIFEIMEQHVNEHSGDALRDDVRRLRTLWMDRRRSRFTVAKRIPWQTSREPSLPATVRRREETLGALALGQAPCDPEPRVASDPAAELYADLVASMREGVLYETLPFLVRVLFVSIGSQATMEVIAAYCEAVPPEPFGADEARHFIDYIKTRELPVSHLASILEFAEALLAVSGRPGERAVSFDCDPAILFDALKEGRCPGPLPRERFNVSVSANGVRIVKVGSGALNAVASHAP
jgi:uncharacterized protein (UPF0276 family)